MKFNAEKGEYEIEDLIEVNKELLKALQDVLSHNNDKENVTQLSLLTSSTIENIINKATK